MHVIYRRPDPAALAQARTRLSRLAGAGSATVAEVAEVAQLPTPAPPEPAAPAGQTEPGVTAPAATGWAALLDRVTPAALRGARLDPGRRGVAAVALVTVVAGGVTGWGVWHSRPRAMPVSAPRVEPASASPSAGPTVVVAVAGGVRHPGLFTLPAGARVADALRAAGGVRPGVDVGLLNLARRLADGEQVVVGAAAPAGAGPAPAPGQGALLDLNTATAGQLDSLPGVGPVLAERIIAYRTQHGRFRSVDQLREVNGIGEAKYADLRSLVSV